MNKKEVIKSFWQQINKDGKLKRQKNKKDALGQHTTDIRNAFANYITDLQSNGDISEEIANTTSLYHDERDN